MRESESWSRSASALRWTDRSSIVITVAYLAQLSYPAVASRVETSASRWLLVS